MSCSTKCHHTKCWRRRVSRALARARTAAVARPSFSPDSRLSGVADDGGHTRVCRHGRRTRQDRSATAARREGTLSTHDQNRPQGAATTATIAAVIGMPTTKFAHGRRHCGPPGNSPSTSRPSPKRITTATTRREVRDKARPRIGNRSTPVAPVPEGEPRYDKQRQRAAECFAFASPERSAPGHKQQAQHANGGLKRRLRRVASQTTLPARGFAPGAPPPSSDCREVPGRGGDRGCVRAVRRRRSRREPPVERKRAPAQP